MNRSLVPILSSSSLDGLARTSVALSDGVSNHLESGTG
jgi:hypothetical protein